MSHNGVTCSHPWPPRYSLGRPSKKRNIELLKFSATRLPSTHQTYRPPATALLRWSRRSRQGWNHSSLIPYIPSSYPAGHGICLGTPCPLAKK